MDQIRCENPNIKQRKKRKNKRKTKEKKIRSKLHHQSLIWCKRCEIPCYYQQIRYINSSNVKNTFGFLWKKLRKSLGRLVWLVLEALCDHDMAVWVGWAWISEIVHEEVRAGRASFSLWWYLNGDESDLEMRVLYFSEESHWRDPSKVAPCVMLL